MTSKYLGTWWAVAGVWAFCIAWIAVGLEVNTLTLALSIFALSFSQLILRDTSKLTERQNEKLDAIVHGTDADDSVADDTP